MKKHLHFVILLVIGLLWTGNSYSQTLLERQNIIKDYNQQQLSNLKTSFQEQSRDRKAEALQQAQANNWPVTYQRPDGGLAELMYVAEDGRPVYFETENSGAAVTSRANTLYNGGSLGLNVEGQNMNIGVWDGAGVRLTHELFNGRVTQQDVPSTPLDPHSSHVAGTLIGNGNVASGNARGMAHQATLDAYDWNSDEAEVAAAAANGLLVSSHSYGVNAEPSPVYYLGKYDANARNYDELMYNAPFYQMVCSAGNDQQDNVNLGDNGYDKLTDMSLSKNALVVAAVSQVDNYTGPGSVVMSNFSTWGPTDDGRVKPDISAKGVSVYSSTSSSDTSYGTSSGTSMATPSVAGTILLLQQHHNDVNSSYMRAATLRGLTLHTADEAGDHPGPDYRFGWGLINAEKAAQAISNNGNTSLISEELLTNGSSYSTEINATGNESLMVTIAWTDKQGVVLANIEDLDTPSLVNDLDIRITKGSETFFPWKLDPANPAAAATTGDNLVDNIEKVEIPGATGTYTITVTHKGTLVDGAQNFSIIVTGGSVNPVVCNPLIPQGIAVPTIDSSSATVSWDAVPGAAYTVRYKETGSTTWTEVNVSNNFLELTDLAELTDYEVQVKSICDTSSSDYSASTVFTTTEFIPVYCTSAGNSVADEYISNVQIGSIDNTSTQTGGYTDYTSISTNLDQGNSYPISITPTWTGTKYNEGYAVWIDFNGDGDFEDTNELVFSNAPSQTTPVTGNVTIPVDAQVGSTRMRVSMRYNTIPGPCGPFNYGEVEDYSVVIQETIPDTEAPTVPTNLAASNLTHNSVDLSWTASSDNVAVTGYDLYQDGSLVGSYPGSAAKVNGLSAETTYAFTVVAFDAAGNRSAESAALSVTTSAAPAGPIVLHEGFFESGWDGWQDGGGDCYRYKGTRSQEGDYSIRIRDNSGTSSSMDSEAFDLSSFAQVTVDFWFYSYSMENNEDFWIRYNDGSGWTTVQAYKRGTDFENNSFYSASVTLNSSSYNLVSNGKFRFQCDASGNGDHIYIDQVIIKGHAVASEQVENSIEFVRELEEDVNDALFELEGLEKAKDGILLYPNPTVDEIFIQTVNEYDSFTIRNINGQLVLEGENIDQIDVSGLASGIYVIQLMNNEKTVTKKFIKK